MDLPQDYFASKHVNLMTPESDSSIRLVYSPKEQMLNTGDVRCQEHTDFSTFTLYIPVRKFHLSFSIIIKNKKQQF